MKTDKTIRQIWFSWALIAGFAVFMVTCIVLNLHDGETSNALIGVGGIAFGVAQQILFSLGWDGRGRVQEAYQFAAEAHLYYWRDRNYPEGLSLARRARELGTVTNSLPGGGTTNLGYSSIVALGEVLTGSRDQEALATLQSAHRKLPILGRLLAAWGLAIWHEYAGETSKSSAYLDEIRQTAPYSTPLLTLPDPQRMSSRRSD